MNHDSITILSALACVALALSPSCFAGEIHDAVIKGDLAALDRALKRNPQQVNSHNAPEFDTPLLTAVSLGNPEIVKRLLEVGADPSAPTLDQKPITPLLRACLIAPERLVETWLFWRAPRRGLSALQAAKETVASESGRKVLREALAAIPTEMQARLDILALLLAKKPELNKGFIANVTPLTYAMVLPGTGAAKAVKLLIKAGADVNGRNALWQSPLHGAAHLGVEVEIINALLDAGANTEAEDRNGITPLAAAARSGNRANVDALLSHGARASARDLDGLPVVFHAALGGNDEIVDLISKKAGKNSFRSADSGKLFMAAANGGSKLLAQLLLEDKIDVNIRDEFGFTPLMTAAEYGHGGLARLLISKGADPNATIASDGPYASKGDGLFLFACNGGNLNLVSELLTAKGWPQRPPSLLVNVRLLGRPAIVKLLLEKGADPNARSPRGNSALLAAVMGHFLPGRDDPQESMAGAGLEDDYSTTVELLLEKGAKLEVADQNGTPLIHLAAGYCGPRVMKALVISGANPSLRSPKDVRPLHYASISGQSETARLLLEAGADVNAENGAGDTPLRIAARFANTEVLKILLRAHPDVNAAGKDGFTPIHLAAGHNSFECVRLLLDAGASPNPPGSASTATPLMFSIAFDKAREFADAMNAEEKAAGLPDLLLDMRSRLKIIHALLAAGARTDVFPSSHASMEEFAEKAGTPEIVELLRHPPPVVRKRPGL